MYHAIFTGFPSAEATNVQIQGFFPVEKIILRVDWELKKSGYQKSEPISVHFCEVYQSHIRWWGYRKTDPEQQKTVPTPKGYKNLTFTPGLLKLFMVYGGSEGNRTPVRKHFHGTFSERSFCIKVSPLCAPRSRLTDQLSRYSLTLPGGSRKVSCMFDAGSGACR